MGDDLGESEFKDFIFGRPKSQQEMDTQIDRLCDEFRKNESSEEIHALGREEYRDADELAEMPHGGRTPCKYGSATNYKRNKKKSREKSIPSGAGLDLSG